MRFLAINTAGDKIEAVAVYDDKSEYFRLDKVMASEQLLPHIDEVLDKMGLSLSDFDCFVCVVGPGSFTGIRIGINTVRAFGYALGKSVYGVTYGRVLAYSSVGRTTVYIDGGGSACYRAVFDGDEQLEDYECIYKKNVALEGECIADFDIGAKRYEGGQKELVKAAMYAIKNKSGSDPVYIRKPQPERKENDI